eukprot:scaffold8529_cov137-Cylindrotheca_fusiformis.AAC.9
MILEILLLSSCVTEGLMLVGFVGHSVQATGMCGKWTVVSMGFCGISVGFSSSTWRVVQRKGFSSRMGFQWDFFPVVFLSVVLHN